MNFLELITRQEPIAGLEVSDDHVRLALLKTNKSKSKTEVKALAEEPLPFGIVTSGVIVDEAQFTLALQRALKKLGVKIRFVVLSIPSENVFFQIFRFPLTIDEEKVKESMNLRMQFQLPFNAHESYTDWEKINRLDVLETALVASKKNVIDAYIRGCAAAKVQIVACEHHVLSLARLMKTVPEKTYLVRFNTPSGTYVFITRDKLVYFSRFLPKGLFPSEEKIKKEVERIQNFHESSESGADIFQSMDTKTEAYSSISKRYPEWQVALGAAFRGIISRSEDKIVSLMPVGTEVKFEFENRLVYVKFIRNLTIGLSLFFAIGFLGAAGFMANLEQSTIKETSSSTQLNVPKEALASEANIIKLSNLIQLTYGLLGSEYKISLLLEELQSRSTDGISINGFLLPSPTDKITIQGVAKSRAQLNQFKKSLETSPMLAQVTLPLKNIELTKDIPYEITLTIKDPSSLSQANVK